MKMAINFAIDILSKKNT